MSEKKIKKNKSEIFNNTPSSTQFHQWIEVNGAREHNLKNIDVKFPRNKLVVVTGLSGSGKSSLAFDTIYAEGQRRYLETFNAYSRQFLGGIERPDVDRITGLSPVIAIEQKTTGKNPRSTVGTITEIYDFLRLLYARIGIAYSYNTGEEMIKMSEDQIVQSIVQKYQHQTIALLAPIVKGRKGHYRELFEQIRKQGFLKVRVDGEVLDLVPKMQVDRYKIHDIEIVIDRIKVGAEADTRLVSGIQQAMKQAKGIIKVLHLETNEAKHFSKYLMCPTTGLSYDEPQPNSFSFNSPYGACEHCDGLGFVNSVDIDLLIPNKKLSIADGALVPLGKYRHVWTFEVLKGLSAKAGFSLETPIQKLTPEQLHFLIHGTKDIVSLQIDYNYIARNVTFHYYGILQFLEAQNQKYAQDGETRLEDFYISLPCPECHGARLKKESLFFKIDNKNIFDAASLDIKQLHGWISTLENKLSQRHWRIAEEIIKELKSRIGFLLDVGLDYLTLHRNSGTLSGGEAQRIRLATQIGSQLVNVLYILDEPSIGLHQRDNERLIDALKNLRDIGNTVLVVEHDQDMILQSDYVIDMGPAAGIHGGHVVAAGVPSELKNYNTVTTDYLSGRKSIVAQTSPRSGNGKMITLLGATGNNLKEVNLKIPLGKFICVTGVSGSGKSTLINETLYPIMNKHFFRAKQRPLPYKSIDGLQHIDKVIEIDQSPIGRTPRSNPATYTNVFNDIRNLFVQLPESKIRGYEPGRFSFNVKNKGRCEDCEGGGMKIIEMNFLPDVQVLCETCRGKRYNRETLEVRYKGKSIADVLNMSIEEAVPFFEHIPSIQRKVKTLLDVGLGYITLGQSSTTLSGGEAQRVKLATELSKKDTGNTFYILDEPTTGLHFEDINVLLNVLNSLVDKGNTVLVIEHNLDVIKVADHIIDLGPEGGAGGGTILFEGTPQELAASKVGYTARYF